MLELPHVLTGAAIAVKIPNPLLSIPLAFLSHFLIDAVPHWNPHLYTETKTYGQPSGQSKLIVAIDVLVSLVVGFSIAIQYWPDAYRVIVILLACFASVFLDVIEGFYFFLGNRSKFLENLINFQQRHQGRASLIPGVATQVVLLLIVAFLLRAR